MPSTQPSDLNPQVSLNSPKRIWIINPFDQLPNETDVPLRYWALCRTFAEQGHDVVWWSSDFSHLTKSKRSPCPDTDGFAVRLIETPPYTKNISLARLKNHQAFADGFYSDAMAGLTSGELKAPDRIVVSLPPLGVAEQAFRIREFINHQSSLPREGRLYALQGAPHRPHSHSTTPNAQQTTSDTTTSPCEVCVDIMDAWPETFYQALPKPLRKILGPVLLAPLHRSAKRAYCGADKISAVGQSYLDLAQKYLSRSDTPVALDNTKQATAVSLLQTPTHLCYHGSDLSRFRRDKSEGEAVKSESENQHKGRDACPQASSLKTSAINVPSAPKGHPLQSPSALLRANRSDLPSSHSRASSSIIQDQSSLPKADHQSSAAQPRETDSFTRSTSHPHSSLPSKLLSAAQPLKAVYLGAMGSGYDLETIIEVAARWKTENIFPFQIHFAGDGPQREALEARCAALGLLADETSGCQELGTKNQEQTTNNKQHSPFNAARSAVPRIVFHGFLQKDAITDLLLSADLALVPNRPDSLVACPYKAGEYAAAGLPMVSCLGGELGDLLKQWGAGSEYNEGDVESLHAAFKNTSNDPDLLEHQGLNARKMAEALFDRERSYAALAAFIIETDSP